MTASTPTTHSLPPPLELRAADRLVGWIHGDVVRFHGFDSRRGAARAAVVAHRAMIRRLARGSRDTASSTETNLDFVRRKTDHANATANGHPAASVLQTSAGGINGSDTGEFAFEIRVPPPVDELRMRGFAYVMYRALHSSGVAWPLFGHEALPEALTALEPRTATEWNESVSRVASRALDALRRFLGRASRTWRLPRPRAPREELGSASAS